MKKGQKNKNKKARKKKKKERAKHTYLKNKQFSINGQLMRLATFFTVTWKTLIENSDHTSEVYQWHHARWLCKSEVSPCS